ncbi:hypothetical protein TrST_g2227 [Triparma strigata]|uniref:Uncharacterized protein n=1 Tax=Triparma strigata TaxID=1606541 RepID=A0A9W7AQT3_9STRA|nr:hypothetical protein TrST_g2227 [Triparma strigata]
MNEDFDYDLQVMHNLYPPSGSTILSGSEDVKSPHLLTSYSTQDESGFATITVLEDGGIHGLIYRNGELYQIDVVDVHAETLGVEGARRMKEETEMVAFKRSERFVKKEQANCREPVDGRHTDDHHDHEDDHGHSPDEELFKLLSTPPLFTRSTRHLSSDAGDPDRWTECFQNDNVARKLSMGVATDYLFYTSLGSSSSAVQSKVAEIVADTNTIYVYQMNIFLQVDELYIKTTAGGENWNTAASETAGNCNMGIDPKLDELRFWSKSGGARPSDRGLWHLLTPCYPSGTVGLAYVGALCSGSSGYNTGVSAIAIGSSCCSDWTTFAHEVGHNFGGSHSFEEGQGSTGGIMDYGDGLLNNIYQFNSKYRKSEICNHIGYNINCQHFSSYAPVCGNGVVEMGEECECQDGGTNCGCCLSCSLPLGADCASGECCDTTTCKFHKVTTRCGTDDLKHCDNGVCSTTQCSTYGLEYCGPWTDNDCKIKCVYGGTCQTLDGYTPVGLNYAPDDSQCLTQAGASGTCSSGGCVASSSGVTYDWVEGSWSSCSVTCGAGTQSRSVVCKDSNGNAASSASLCTNSKPPTSQACTQPACPTYAWKSEDEMIYSQCTHDCDGGTQSRIGDACVSSTGSTVSDTLCSSYATNTEPRATRPCGTEACPIIWDFGSWGACSRACGTGTQTRTVSCKKTRDSVTTVVDDSLCSGTKPDTSKDCNTQVCSTYEWLTSNWGGCNTGKQDPFTGASCGSGTQDRVVTCIQTNDNDKVVDDSFCAAAKPGTSQSCQLSDCPGSEAGDYRGWVYSDYGACSVSCGDGIQYRELYCLKDYLDESDQSRKQLEDGELAGLDASRILSQNECTMAKPRLSRECSNDPCPEYDFVASAWSACSQECGVGTKTRTVACYNVATASTPTLVADSLCLGVNLVKPYLEQSCYVKSCSSTCGPDSTPCSGFWAVSQWSSCDKPCGYGFKSRTVSCLKTSNGRQTNDRNCYGNRPSEIGDCNAFDCPTYEVGEWGECDVACGDGVERRSVDCKDHLGRVVEGECDLLVRPSEEKPCYDQPCAHWHRGMWSDCGRTCGGGVQERSVDCRLPHDDDYKGILVDPDDVALLCPEDKPATTQECNIDSCAGYYWNVSSWGSCSRTCNTGSQSRTVTCHSSPLDVAAGSLCEQFAGAEPPTTQACNAFACPSYEWAIVGDFGECDADCGGGVATRRVQCHDLTGDSVFGYDIPYKIVDDSFCSSGKKPTETQSCSTDTNGECGGNGVCRSKECFCRPGYMGNQCDQRPKIENVTIVADSGLIATGLPQGNVLEVRWESIGDIDIIDVYLEPGSVGTKFEGKAVSKLPIPITSSNRYPNDEVFLFEVPARPHGSEVFDDYNIRVWHADGLSDLSPSFEISDQCAYKSCGEFGVCSGGDSKCVCSNGYSGEDCGIAPCVRARCSEADPGVSRCFVNATNFYEVSCECEEGWTGDSCQHRVECKGLCENGGVATQVIVAPEIAGQSAVQCYPEGTTQNWCDCPRDSSFEGNTCETCALTCNNGGKPDGDCTLCVCKGNYFGSKCDCMFDEYKMKMMWTSGAEDDVVGEVILGLPSMDHEGLKADAQRRADVLGLEALIKHDLMKTLLESEALPGFGGNVDDVEIDVEGEGVFWVTFKLKGLCYDEPIGRRRVSEEAEEELKLAREVLTAAGDDEYSTLRSGGRVTSSFVHFTDPNSHWWHVLVIVFCSFVGVLILGAVIGFVIYKLGGFGGVGRGGRLKRAGAAGGNKNASTWGANFNPKKRSSKPPPKLPKRKSKMKTELTKLDYV